MDIPSETLSFMDFLSWKIQIHKALLKLKKLAEDRKSIQSFVLELRTTFYYMKLAKNQSNLYVKRYMYAANYSFRPETECLELGTTFFYEFLITDSLQILCSDSRANLKL